MKIKKLIYTVSENESCWDAVCENGLPVENVRASTKSLLLWLEENKCETYLTPEYLGAATKTIEYMYYHLFDIYPDLEVTAELRYSLWSYSVISNGHHVLNNASKTSAMNWLIKTLGDN